MSFTALNQKAFNFASGFIEADDPFTILENEIKRIGDKIVTSRIVLRSIFGQFYNLWTSPLN